MCEPKRDVPVIAAVAVVAAAKLLAPALAFAPLLVAAEAVVAVAWTAWLVRLLMPRRAAAPPPVARAALTRGPKAIEGAKRVPGVVPGAVVKEESWTARR
jgi:hypothetical protein